MKRFFILLLALTVWTSPVWADFDVGKSAYERGEYAKSLHEFKPLADRGNAKAQHMLGTMYLLGQGVKMDWAEAVKWLRMAAKQGLGEAQATLNNMNVEGKVTPPQSWVKNEKQYREAAAQGDADALFRLGENYYYGWTVQRDDKEAARLFDLAAVKDHVNAQYYLGLMHFSGEGVDKDRKKAAFWLRQSSVQGLTDGMSLLGLIYENGYDVPKDLEEALYWFSLRGDEIAIDNVKEKLTTAQIANVQKRIGAWQTLKQSWKDMKSEVDFRGFQLNPDCRDKLQRDNYRNRLISLIKGYKRKIETVPPDELSLIQSELKEAHKSGSEARYDLVMQRPYYPALKVHETANSVIKILEDNDRISLKQQTKNAIEAIVKFSAYKEAFFEYVDTDNKRRKSILSKETREGIYFKLASQWGYFTRFSKCLVDGIN